MIDAYYWYRGHAVCGWALLASVIFGETAAAQVQLPEVVVSGAKTKTEAAPRARRRARDGSARRTPAAQLNSKANAFDQARGNLYTTTGTTTAAIS